MTCIVGLVEGDKIYMGGDSAGISGYSLTVRADEKVFHNGPFLMGFTSSFRMGQLLRYSFVPPKHQVDMDDDTYMVTLFIDAVRKCLKDGGYAEKRYEAEQGGTFLVGYRKKLYCIHEDYQVAKAADGYMAIGCGQDVALGALYTLQGDSPRDVVMLALNAAERFSAGVRRPFMVLEQ